MSKKPIRVLHFADAHIDMVNYGRMDAESGLPMRVLDYLSSLDQIVDRAIDDQVDLVIFAGDAYRNQRPHPRFQREWQSRIRRLSEAAIPTILLVGNHDTSPSVRQAHALQEFKTLGIPHVFVADNPVLLTPEQLGCAVQVVTIPWISKSRLRAREGMADKSDQDLEMELEDLLAKIVEDRVSDADPDVPLILTAHASVQGAQYGSERQVMLGKDLVLGGQLVNDKRIDYVALGHIHQHQDVSKGGQPPIVYAGSIEKVDFGEVNDKKGYVMAEVVRGKTEWEFVELNTRRFVDSKAEMDSAETFMEDLMKQLPDPDSVTDAICRLQLYYKREHEPLVDDKAIGRHYKSAFSLQVAKHRSAENRSRLGDTVKIDELTAEDMLSTYWQTLGLDVEESAELQALSKEIFGTMLQR